VLIHGDLSREVTNVFHLAAYFAALGVNAADSDVAALSDQALTIQNNHFIFPRPLSVIWAYYIAASATRAKIQSPKTRIIADPYIRPIERGSLPGSRPSIADYSNRPIDLNQLDEIRILGSNNLGAATEPSYAFLGLQETFEPAPQGTLTTLRATTVVTTVTRQWTFAALVFDQTLPAGRYAVVGMDAYATNLIAARLAFVAGGWRPGVICSQSVGQTVGDYFRRGNYGLFGRFDSTAQPSVEFLSEGAATNPEVYLDLIKVG
jgi:hypothetical protein